MSENTNVINKEAWDKYQDAYMKFHLMSYPDYYEFYANGGIRLDNYLIAMIGDVRSLKLLDTCCACDAAQAFSWHNLGAKVTACDISPSAIRIAKENAGKMKLAVDFITEDMQTLASVNDNEFDVVFASFPIWLSAIDPACRSWHRVLKKGGRVLLHAQHPIMECITETNGEISIIKNYNERSVDYYDSFEGTPLADRHGGWSVDLPVVENFYSVSDLINAICNAGFRIINTHESAEGLEEGSVLSRLPDSFALLAVK